MEKFNILVSCFLCLKQLSSSRTPTDLVKLPGFALQFKTGGISGGGWSTSTWRVCVEWAHCRSLPSSHTATQGDHAPSGSACPGEWRSSHTDWDAARRPAASQTDTATWDLALPGSPRPGPTGSSRPSAGILWKPWMRDAEGKTVFSTNIWAPLNQISVPFMEQRGKMFVSVGGWQSQLIPYKSVCAFPS